MPLDLKETTTDWLACKCGNIPISDGFYACLEDGRTVEPDADGLWGGALYLCAGCFSIYNIYTLEDLGKASDIAIQMFNMGITQ